MGDNARLRIDELPEQRLAAVRHVGPYQGIGAAFDRLGDWAQAHADAVLGAPLAVYVDDPARVPPEALRSDAAVPVSEDVTIGGAPGMGVPGVGEVRLAGGRYAVHRHVGPYEGLAGAWRDFMVEVGGSGAVADPTRPCFEVYANEPGTVPDDQLVTLLHLPVA
jgi:AraC family transcriptional regulator